MADKDNDFENENFESDQEFDINEPHYDQTQGSHDIDGDFEAVDVDSSDTIDISSDDFDTDDSHLSEDLSFDEGDFESSFEEGWEEDNDSFESEADHAPMEYEKPQRNWFNIAIVGVLGLVVVGALAFFVFGGGDNDQSQPSGMQTASNADNTMAPVSGSAENNESLAQQAISGNGANGNQSLLDNPQLLGVTATSDDRPDPEASENEIFEALNNKPVIPDQEVDDIFAALENLQDANSQPSTVVEDIDTQPMPEPSDNGGLNTQDLQYLANMNETETVTEIPKPRLPDQETAETSDVEVDVLPVVEQNPQPTTDQVTTTNTAASPETGQQLTDLNNRLDQFAARLESLSEKLDMVENAPTQQPSASNTSELSAMEKTVATLEAKIKELEKEKAAPAPKKAQPTRTTSAPVQRTPTRAAPQWDLRGASPGQAYVAERGTQNLRTVSVGDSLSGVGRITSIAQQSGRWVVQGTSGRITQ